MKKFSQLAFPYIVWAILMLVFPMVLIALYSVTDQGNTISIVHIYTGTLCQIFYRPGFLIDPLAFHCNCGEDNGDLSVAGLSDCILYCAQ